MNEFLQYMLDFVSTTSMFERWLFIVFLFTIAPALFIPISFVSYLSGFLLTEMQGLVAYIFGYTSSIIFYYFVLKYILSRFESLPALNKVIHKWIDKVVAHDFISISLASLIVPYLPLVTLCVFFKLKLGHIIGAILLTTFPFYYLMYHAASIGKSYDGLYTTTKVIVSICCFCIIVLGQLIFGRCYAKKS